MLKLKYSHNCSNLFKFLLVTSLFISPKLGLSNEVSNEKLLAKPSKTPQNISSPKEKTPPHDQKYRQKNKKDVEALFGTWIILLNSDNITYTTKVVLDRHDMVDELDIISGAFYLKENSAQILISCTKKNNSEGAFDTPFLCITHPPSLSLCPLHEPSSFLCEPSPVQAFELAFSHDDTVKGIFSFGGDDVEAVPVTDITSPPPQAVNLLSNPTPASGFRQHSALPLVETTFSENNTELLIPILNYQGIKYRIVLQNNGDFIFHLGAVEDSSTTGAWVGLEASYDETNAEIFIPMLQYENNRYSVILKNTGNFVFTLQRYYPVEKLNPAQDGFSITPTNPPPISVTDML